MPTTTDHGFPGIYNSTLNTVPDGKGGALAIDENQRLILGTGTASIGSVISVGNVASDAADSGNPVKVGLKVNVTSPTFTDGDRADMQGDINAFLKSREQYVDQFVDNTNAVAATHHKPLAVSTYTYTIDRSAALEASTIVNAGPCNIRLISGRIDSTAPTATYYLQRINSTTLPADGAVTLLDAPTKFQHTTGTDTPVLIDYTMNCINASTGGVICLSTTEFTKTISGAYLSLTVMYKA